MIVIPYLITSLLVTLTLAKGGGSQKKLKRSSSLSKSSKKSFDGSSCPRNIRGVKQMCQSLPRDVQENAITTAQVCLSTAVTVTKQYLTKLPADPKGLQLVLKSNPAFRRFAYTFLIATSIAGNVKLAEMEAKVGGKANALSKEEKNIVMFCDGAAAMLRSIKQFSPKTLKAAGVVAASHAGALAMLKQAFDNDPLPPGNSEEVNDGKVGGLISGATAVLPQNNFQRFVIKQGAKTAYKKLKTVVKHAPRLPRRPRQPGFGGLPGGGAVPRI